MNNSEGLFNSKTKPIPGVRRELEVIPVKNNGHSYLYFHDSMGYATPDFALNSQAGKVLSLLDGRKSIEDLSPYLGKDVSTDQLLNYIRFLDENRLLLSGYFRQHAEQIEQDYEQSDTHQSVTAGLSYPEDPEELKGYLDDAFSEASTKSLKEPGNLKALYAPHIDPRVGIKNYVSAFTAIKNLKPSRVVILATSHYAGYHSDLYSDYPFIAINKDFQLPLGALKADKEAIDALLVGGEETGLTDKDRAHRIEHSIELHLLFLSYIWSHEYQIVPILVNSLDELYYMPDGYRGKQVNAFAQSLSRRFGDDKETFFLISGDLAHVGKKFGDQQPAQELFDEVKTFDQRFLKHAEQGAEKEMLQFIGEHNDPYRICGFPPLYTFLRSMPNLRGKVLNYDVWDEEERESAVSFGSVLYHKKG